MVAEPAVESTTTELSPEAEAERAAAASPKKAAEVGEVVQDGQGAESDADDEDEDEEPDPVEVAKKEATKAELKKLAVAEGLEGDFETAEQLQEARNNKATAQWEQQRQDAHQERTRSAYHSARTSLEKALDGFTLQDDDGNSRRLTEAERQPFIKVLGDFNNLAGGLYEGLYGQMLTESGLRVIPRGKHEAFLKDVQQTDYDGFIRAVIEHGAGASAAVKGLTLEDARKLSPKLEADVTALVEATEKRVKKEIKGGNRGGEPSGNGRGAGRSDAERLADPTTPVTELIEIRARQRAAGG